MPLLFRVYRCRPAGRCRTGTRHRRPVDRAGVYLTNEVFLYRVVGLVASQAGEMVEVEDCYGLDVVRVPVASLRARQLRVVTPTPAQ